MRLANAERQKVSEHQ